MSGPRQDNYRVGDRVVQIGGVRHRLRFSVSALAEIAHVFGADSPKALAASLRTASVADWNAVLGCVATPRLEQGLTRQDMAHVLPMLSQLIKDGLRA